MADILLSKIKSIGTGVTITYHSNDIYITTTYSAWVPTEETRYRIQATDTSCFPGTDVEVTLYVNQVSKGTYLIEYESSTGGWTGSLTYDGVTMRLVHSTLQTFNIDEEFTLERTLVTLGKDDFLAAAGAKVYKCTLIHSGGSTIVYHEQILTPTFVSCTKGPTTLQWYFKNEDPDIPVNMYARVGTAGFTLKASNVAAGENGLISFSGLSGSTSYNVDVYCVPVTSGLKINSAEATNTQTTLSNATYSWYYDDTFSSSQSTDYFTDDYSGSGYTLQEVSSYLNADYPCDSSNEYETHQTEMDQDVFHTWVCFEN